MKAVLEFNLPEEEEEFKLINRARDYYIVVENIRDFIRSKLRYNQMSEDVEQVLYRIEEMMQIND